MWYTQHVRTQKPQTSHGSPPAKNPPPKYEPSAVSTAA
jgi:hypothetical protein